MGGASGLKSRGENSQHVGSNALQALPRLAIMFFVRDSLEELINERTEVTQAKQKTEMTRKLEFGIAPI